MKLILAVVLSSGAFGQILPTVTGCTQSLGAGSTLAITAFGPGFLPDSRLLWNGSPLTTTLVGTTQLTASVPAGLVSGTDSATVSVASSGIISYSYGTEIT